MSDETTTTETSAATEGEVTETEATEEQSPSTPEVETPATETDEPLSEGGKKALEAEREAKKALERELAALREGSVSKDEFATLTAERDQLKTEIETLRGQLAARDLGAALDAKLTEKGVRNLKLARKVIDLDGFDPAAGDLSTLIDSALEEFPELLPASAPVVKEGLGTAGAVEGTKTPPTGKYLTREQVKALSEDPVEWEKNRDLIFESQKRWK